MKQIAKASDVDYSKNHVCVMAPDGTRFFLRVSAENNEAYLTNILTIGDTPHDAIARMLDLVATNDGWEMFSTTDGNEAVDWVQEGMT